MAEAHQDWLERKIMEPVMHDLTFEQKLRIEALRAAARIIAGTFAELMRAGHLVIPANTVDKETLHLAKQFHRYLEGGDASEEG